MQHYTPARHTLKKLTLTALLSCILAACTVSEPQQAVVYGDKQSPKWQQQLQQLNRIQAYRSNGQLGYISPEERFSTRFDWQFVNDQSYQLHLSSSLSASTLTFRMTSQGLIVTDNKGNLRAASNAGELLKEIVGMEFPIQLFSYWLKGQPQGTNDYQITPQNVLAKLSYRLNGQQWSATYSDYYSEQLPPLPKDILIDGQRQQLKIRIDDWTF
ncbi:hypothetical protein A1D23_04915 [Chelonobacter oris]|uniref:lipoprotein insertase outer membrane protein LolB n=1 Tax=Chelonobacter oris TaxID=505317 RepID=UPI002446F2D9|nr:lipoprotein insertase outer membrane protein LolB [Chelonobacter oris]MDH2999441.1 hypothetical protein [Chelonobacter oris]